MFTPFRRVLKLISSPGFVGYFSGRHPLLGGEVELVADIHLVVEADFKDKIFNT